MCQGILECEVLVGTRSAEGIMASGYVNRIKRPNTWPQRPMLQNREESSCQTGPSTHGTFRTRLRLETVMRCKADIGGDEHRGLFKQVTLNRGRPMAPASEVT